MRRSSQLRRSGFARWSPKPPKVYEVFVPRPRPVALRVPDTRARMTAPMPKTVTVRSKPLLEACRQLACQRCGANDCTVAAAHSNWSVHGKGKSRKADDTRVASMCWACHLDIDSGSLLSRHQRKAVWWNAHVKTVLLLVETGLWPASVAVPDITINPFEETSCRAP